MKLISSPYVKRWLQLLHYIEIHKDFTISALTAYTKVSQRTIIKDMKYFKAYFKNSAIFTYGINGYHFKELQPDLYKEKKQALLKDEILFEIIAHIFYGELDTVEGIAFSYHYSESTLRRKLSKLKTVLRDYDLILNINPIDIIGNEGNIRKFFKDFYYEGDPTPHTLMPPQDLYERISAKLNENHHVYEVGTGTSISDFYYSLYVTIERYRNNHTIRLDAEIEQTIYNEKDFNLMYTLSDIIFDNFDVLLPKTEFAWLYLTTISKRTIYSLEQEETFIARFDCWPHLTTLTTKYLALPKEKNIDSKKLTTFIHAFFISRKLNDLVSPALNKVISEIKTYAQRSRPALYQQHISFLRDNLSYFSIQDTYLADIAAALTILKENLIYMYAHSKKIIFLLEGDHYVCQNIRMKAIQLFSTKHELRFPPIHELSASHFATNPIDLIITNYPQYISDYVVNTAYELIHTIPDENDWNRIIDRINAI